MDTAQLSGEEEFKYRWRTSGTFTLEVEEDHRIKAFSATLAVEATTEGSIEASAVAASGQIPPTTTELQLVKAPGEDAHVYDEFSAKGRLKIGFAGQTRTPEDSRNFRRTGADDVTVTFFVQKATCQGADGVFERSGLKDRYERMRQGGMEIEQGPAKWHAELKDASSHDEDMATLKKKLAEARSPPGPNPVVRTRTVEMKMYVDIAEWIDGRPKTVKPCLREVWRGAVQDRLYEWFAADTPAMRNHQGDLVSYHDKVQRLIEVDQGVALLGLDECLAAPQQARSTP